MIIDDYGLQPILNPKISVSKEYYIRPIGTFSSVGSVRGTPTRVQNYATVDSVHFDVQTFGSSLPVKVMEALTTAEADDQISVKVDESGWAWMVCGERLIIWKICQTPVAKLSVCKDLQLAPSEYTYSADLISISSSSPLESATVQSVYVLAVSPEGFARFWPSLAHEGTYTETHTDLGGHLCNYVTAVRGGSFIVSSFRGQLLRVSADGSGKLLQRALQQGQGMLSGIGRRVSSLFGIRGPPADTSVHSVLWVGGTGYLYTLSTCGLNKWEVTDNMEVQVLSWNACPSITDSIADAIWGSESNYAEMKEGVNVAYLDMQLSHAGLVVLAAAWHPADTPCLAYFCLVTLPDTAGPASDELSVEVTKYNPPFQVKSENLTDELFPAEGEAGAGELDAVVTQIDLDLVDDYPASDPRWAESVPDESAGFTLTSLILLHQLEDKMKAHHCFMDFLLQTGLLDRLSSVSVRSSPMATRLLLCEHAEKLTAAIVLKNHHSKQPELVNSAILTALKKSGTDVPASLTPADVFFREVSQISSIFECLLDEEEKCLKSNPVGSVKWAEVVLNVNIIIKDMLQAAAQYRETKASLYRAAENTAPEPEYIPWTASGGVGGVRTVIVRQHEVVLRLVYPHADSSLRSTLNEQLVALLDSLLGGYVAQLTSLRRPGQQERYNALEMEYTQRRSELLTPLQPCLNKCSWIFIVLSIYSWSASDSTDDPLEAAKESIFVKILQKLIQEGTSYLPDVKDLLQVEELDSLKSRPFFEFLLRANYEHYLQSQI
uniref:Nucleoporin 133 n=1 Tax=Astyanax mexicanus TaxID=7994 RepID=A0A8B9HMN1_ASTMX